MALATRDGFHRPSPDVSLWRYLDVTRFALLLSDKEIYFSRLGLLEGRDPRVSPDVLDSTYISNWHQQPAESMAMWDRYAGRGAYVLLKTTLDRLQYALKDSETDVTAGRIAYRDFTLSGERIDTTGLEGALLFSRPALAHLQEVRLYTSLPPTQRPRPGFGVRIDVPDAFDEVIISPRADLATLRAVRALGSTYASRLPVRPSTMLDEAR